VGVNPLIDNAIHILRAGGLVAFPTETVYGLGADATNPAAIAKIFAAKGRPATNPLIVHVADATVARRYAAAWPTVAEKLAQAFWPGPLTLVVPKSDAIVPAVTAGRGTVGLRSPDHPLALELLRAFDGPVAAPSANRSNRISPTTAEHVRKDLGDRVDLILDGGPSRVGIESTVLDVSGTAPAILRLGGVSRQQIEAVIGPVAVAAGIVDHATAATSPGQQAVHYAPLTPTYRFDVGEANHVAAWCRDHPATPAVILRIGHPAEHDVIGRAASAKHRTVPLPNDPEAYAHHMYAALHAADAPGADRIWVEMPPVDEAWSAVRDRLMRATIDPLSRYSGRGQG
jgi:L-threonylcarbamoyladenylate synthase